MLHAKIFRICLIALIFSLTAIAQNPNETHSGIRKAVESRDYAAAVSELQNLQKSDAKVFALNNYDYLLARMAEKTGNFAIAAANYESAVKRNSVLSEYAQWHLAQIARSSGNLMLERIYLRRISTTAPASLLKNAVTARALRSNFESKDFETVVSGQWSAVSNGKNETRKTEDRETLVYLGQSYLQLGKTNEAREIFSRLVTNLPNASQPDDFALAGARGLDEIDGGKENFGKLAPQIDGTEHYRRAVIYQFNRNFAFARIHYMAIVQQFPQFMLASEAMYQIGRGFAQENNFEQAINWFERVQSEFPAQPISRDALSQTAAAYSRVNKNKEAIARYQKYIEKYPDAENLDRAYLNIIDIKRDTGEETDALKWTQKTREVFKGKLPEAIALFAQARIHIAQNDWTNALADLNELQNFSDLGGTRVPGGTNKTEVIFLKAFVLENIGRYAEAIDAYLSIPDGRGEYYGWRATERLRALGTDEKAKSQIESKTAALKNPAGTPAPDESRKNTQAIFRLTNDVAQLDLIKKTYSELPDYKNIPAFNLLNFGRKEVLKESRQIQTSYHQTLADELLFLGLYDEGTPELETALREKMTPTASDKVKSLAGLPGNSNNLSFFPADTAYTLAVFYTRGDLANRAVSYLEALWRNVPADYQVELMPREQVGILYPAPYTDALLQFAPPKNVDPRFALSIMRQESRYRADVKSYAAARGLMQFISTTSDRLAAELGKTDFRQDELYNPPTAILFGSQYLADLFQLFPNQPPAVAAGYNGGETNMARWMARAKSDNPDRYVPEIIFSQSKDYVYKVMANYRVYQAFYDEKLKNR